jgi:hypothetical protein
MITVLVAPRTLDEGIDVPDAEVAVIAAGSTVSRRVVQRIGRVLRRAEGKDQARIGLVYVKGAQDDPQIGGALEEFVTDMEEMDRAWWFDAKRDREALREFFSGSPLGRPPSPPTFDDTRAQLHRLHPAARVSRKRHLERDVHARASWELRQIKRRPYERARVEAIQLIKSRDRVLREIATLSTADADHGPSRPL